MNDVLPLFELALGALVLVAICVIHGSGLRRVALSQQRRIAAMPAQPSLMQIEGAIALLVLALLGLHLLATLIWALLIWWLGLIPGFWIAYYFAAETYTTLGYGDVMLPSAWRILAAFIAISGLFTFGWTASVLVRLAEELRQVHTPDEARKQAAAAATMPR